jgi:hypothetical protein
MLNLFSNTWICVLNYTPERDMLSPNLTPYEHNYLEIGSLYKWSSWGHAELGQTNITGVPIREESQGCRHWREKPYDDWADTEALLRQNKNANDCWTSTRSLDKQGQILSQRFWWEWGSTDILNSDFWPAELWDNGFFVVLSHHFVWFNYAIPTKLKINVQVVSRFYT